jgi:UDP-N-acetylmuramate dehydrogenase
MLIRENIPLAPFTTLGAGGPARFFAAASEENHVSEALSFARARSVPVFALGGGSNLVVADAGFPGLVLKMEIPGIRKMDAGGRVAAGAGVEWDAFVQHCVSHDLAGVEALSGIPGTVGGAPIQNIGAYGQEAGETIFSVRAWDTHSDTIVELSRAECAFAYRSSVFNTSGAGRYIVLQTHFMLQPQGRTRVLYADMQKCFADNANPSLAEIRGAVLDIRKSKGMLAVEDDSDSRSAGSFFKNPVISRNEFAAMEQNVRSRGLIASSENIPCFDAPEGNIKLAAAWLIEHSGFSKGYTHGRAGISTKHALALVNRGGAQTAEIVSLMQLIEERVMELFGIALVPEPVFIGFQPGSFKNFYATHPDLSRRRDINCG